jgi:hypothetical protein
MHAGTQAKRSILAVLGLCMVLFAHYPVLAESRISGAEEVEPDRSERPRNLSDFEQLSPEQVGEPFDPPPKDAQWIDMDGGVTNWALGKPVSSSIEPLIGQLKVLTDGVKTQWWPQAEGSYVELDHYSRKPLAVGEKAIRVGAQFVQIDLQREILIEGVWMWHTMPHFGYDVPQDVVVQVSNDSEFGASGATIFNCDRDDSLGFGIGSDRRFATSIHGKLIRVSSPPGRYIRIWSDGSARNNSTTQLVEVEVYGRLTPQADRQEQLLLRGTDQGRRPRYLEGVFALVVAFIALLMRVRHVRRKRKRIELPPDV